MSTSPVVLDLVVSVVVACIYIGLVIVTSTAPRSMRLGITIATSIVIFSLSTSVLYLIGQPILDKPQLDILQSVKILAISWAALDVARVAIRIGTMDPVIAAQTAKGLLISMPAIRSIWAAWAESVPTPAWVKSVGGQMLAVNMAYERRYGKAEHAYVGETDLSVWSDNTAEQFMGNDRIVISTRRTILVEEPAPTWKQPNRVGRFIKFPVLDAHGKLIGVGGIEVES